MGDPDVSDTKAIESTDTASPSSPAFSPNVNKSNKNKEATATDIASRRIVKATPPKPLATDDNNIMNGTNEDKDEDLAKSYIVLESPTVAREVQQEESQKRKNAREKTLEDRRKNAREKALEERRKNPNNVKKTDSVTPNPMSRFLSVFSVEPQHPEHKRSLEVTAEDDDAPSGKKRKAAPDDNDDGVNDTDNTKNRRIGAIVFSVVAAAAVLTLLHFRKRRL